MSIERRLRLLLVVTLALGCSGTSLEDHEDELAGRPASLVELKITIQSDQIDAARAGLALASSSARRRRVYFYDTLQLDLLEQGVILRARKKIDDDDDSTVKIRPLKSSDVAKSWFSIDGFKCEIDRVGSKSLPACSLTTEQGRGEIDDVAAGDRAIHKLYAKVQEQFLEGYGTVPKWSSLEVLGPVAVETWTLERREVPSELSVELWTLPDDTRVLEVSTRAPAKAAKSRQAQLVALLTQLGLDPSGTQETKTQLALAFFTGKAH